MLYILGGIENLAQVKFLLEILSTVLYAGLLWVEWNAL